MTDEVYKTYLSYHQYGNMIIELVKAVSPTVRARGYTHVYGPPRGAWPIMLHLSHSLHLECVHDIYTFIKDNAKNENTKLLVVDDVCDSGQTLKSLTGMFDSLLFTKYMTATLHIKPRAHEVFTPNFWLEKVPDNCWLVYPYEHDNPEPDKDYMESASKPYNHDPLK